MPSRKGPVIARMKEDKAFSKDGPAYKRLRKEGLQPKQIDGCAKVEQLAESRVEVEAMKPLNKRKRDAFEQVTGKTVHEVKIHEGIA